MGPLRGQYSEGGCPKRRFSVDSDVDVYDSQLDCIEQDILHLSDAIEMTEQQKNLWAAANNGHVSVCKIFLLKGVNPNFIHDIYGNSPLHAAVESGHSDVIRLLINQDNCDIDIKDKLGRTPLMEATTFDDVEIVHILHKGGADLDAIDFTGKTSLILGLQSGCKHVTNYLIRHGCDLNIVDHLGQSALYLLLNSIDSDVVKYVKKLIKAGYDVSKDLDWLREEGMDIETIETDGLLSKLSNKLKSRLPVLGKNTQRDVYAETSRGRTMIRILKTYE